MITLYQNRSRVVLLTLKPKVSRFLRGGSQICMSILENSSSSVIVAPPPHISDEILARTPFSR